MSRPAPGSLLVPGKTCWQLAEANRFAIVIDGCDYYRAVKQAMLNAKHQVLLIGWHFDTRTEFQPLAKTLEGPNRLGPFLNWLGRTRPELDIRILQWNWGAIDLIKHGETPWVMLKWLWRRRVGFRLDASHPVAASHHQKIIVIDDAIAFCGGIDITGGRWDTREHLDVNPARRSPHGRRMPPWHDATTCVDGAAAEALGQLARDRWLRATGQQLKQPPKTSDPWPRNLPVMLQHVPVGISRTIGAYADQKQVVEIETLYLRAIAAAKRTIYIESQYFASRRIAEALIARLQEKNGPEIVLINPLAPNGWLQEKTMGSARARLLRHVRRHDPHHRFAAYYPVTANGKPIYVHAKIMIVDDTFLKVGSSNLNNRSMGFDTECDISLDAAMPGAAKPAEISRMIRATRDGLVAEHLGIPAKTIATRLKTRGSLVAAIDRLRANHPCLVPLDVRDLDFADEVMGENDLLDPERPLSFLNAVKSLGHWLWRRR